MQYTKSNPNVTRSKVTVSEREALVAANNSKFARKTTLCGQCRKEYIDHPLVSNVRDWKGGMYVTKICDGSFVKLGE